MIYFLGGMDEKRFDDPTVSVQVTGTTVHPGVGDVFWSPGVPTLPG